MYPMIYLAEQGDYYYMTFTEHMPSVDCQELAS